MKLNSKIFNSTLTLAFSVVALITSPIVLVSCSHKPVDGSSAGAADGPLGSSTGLKEISGDGEQASVVAKPVELPAPGQSVDQKYKALQTAFKSKDDRGLRSEAGKLLTQNPRDIIALNALGVWTLIKGQNKAARIYFDQALAVKHDEPALYNNLSIISLKESNLDLALVQLKQAYGLSKTHPQTLANLGTLYLNYGDWERALPLLKDSYAKTKNSDVGQNYAIALRMSGKLDDSESVYKELIQKESKDERLLLNYSILLVDYLNKGKEAQPYLNKLNFLAGDKPNVINRVHDLEERARKKMGQ